MFTGGGRSETFSRSLELLGGRSLGGPHGNGAAGGEGTSALAGGEAMGKPWENHGKTMGKPWENHGKMRLNGGVISIIFYHVLS